MLGRIQRRLLVASAVIAVVLAARAMWGALGVVLVLLVLGIGGMVSLRIHPRHACPLCGGTSRFYSKLFPWRFRLCSHCGGNGRVMARSAALWGTAAQRRELEEAARARAGARPWNERR
jgi:hypothetical protein